jgi:hypothetical protein
MERRKAVIAAATASLTLLAGAAAISLNTSLVGASGGDGVGQVSPVDRATTPSTIYVDEPAAGLSTSPSQSRDGDDEFEDDEFDDEDELERDGADSDNDSHDDDAYEDDGHEYEGADDDD